MIVVFESELRTWDARRDDVWAFVNLPAAESAEIRDLTAGARRGFGSVRVRATLGASTWATSIFPDGSSGVYALPVKRAIRTAEELEPGDVVTVTVELVDR